MADSLLITIGANVQPAIAAIRQAGQAVQQFATQVSRQVGGAMTQFGTNVSKAFSAVGKAANVAGAIGKELFSSLITPTAIIAGIGLVAKGIYDWATALTVAEKAQKALNSAMDSGQASVQGEIANVHTLVQIAKDESLSREVRLQAMSKLNKEYPETFNNLRLDKSLTDKLTEGETALTDELVRQAQVKANIKLIDKAELTKAEAKADPTEALTLLDKAEIALRSLSNTASLGANIATVSNERLNETYKVQDAIIKGAKANLLKLNTERGKAGTLFVPPAEKKAAKATKPVDTLKQSIQDLEALKKIATEFEQNRLLELKIDLLLRDGSRFTASELSRQIQAIVAGSDIGSKVTTVSVDLPIGKINTDLATIGRSLAAAVDFKPGLIQANTDFENFTAHLEDLIENIKESILVGIGESLGEALAGGSAKDILGGFVSVFADGLKAIGQAMISFGVAKKVLEKLTISGTAAIIAGIALVAAGSFLKASMNKKRFAEGGIVTGPTNAIIGEAGQPEVVFPLNKLNQFITKISGGSQVFIVENRIEGTQLVQLYRRTSNQLGGTFS